MRLLTFAILCGGTTAAILVLGEMLPTSVIRWIASIPTELQGWIIAGPVLVSATIGLALRAIRVGWASVLDDPYLPGALVAVQGGILLALIILRLQLDSHAVPRLLIALAGCWTFLAAVLAGEYVPFARNIQPNRNRI